MVYTEMISTKIEIEDNGLVFVRRTTHVLKDGVEIAATHHRTPIEPGQDVSGQPALVKAICNAAWTPKVVEAYLAEVAARNADAPQAMHPPKQV